MSFLSRAKYLYFKSFRQLLLENSESSLECQHKLFHRMIIEGSKTAFGKEHHFEKIDSYESFRKYVPLQIYPEILPYTEEIFLHKKNILWPGIPKYFGKTSGTGTGCAKYIPVTREFIKCTQAAAKYMITNLAMKAGHADFLEGKVFYISDPDLFEDRNGFPCASISAIKSSNIPWWVKYFSVPGKKINTITNPEERFIKIASAVKNCNINMATALPIWFIKFLYVFEKKYGKKFKEYFPDFKVLLLSGMNYEPYEGILKANLGQHLLILENYTATEGNFAFQDRLNEKGMQLICNQGIFYEFILLRDKDSVEPERFSLENIKMHHRYIVVVSTVSGLWAYRMNDIVEFVSVQPFRLIVCGRVNDVFSPFGEHMLTIEAEKAIYRACEQTGNMIKNFLVTPSINLNQASRHKWYIEFASEFKEREKFSSILNETVCKNNVNYNDLILSKVLAHPVITPVQEHFFEGLIWMRSKHNSVQVKQKHFETDCQRIEDLDQLYNCCQIERHH